MKKKVLVGLSGGVDSSVAAFLLKKQGYDVIGAFMKNFSDTKDPLTGECSWIEEKKMAEKIAAILKIPFIVLDFEKEYKKQVIMPLIQAYDEGKTPNPDVSCNTIIKFPLLWKEARKRGADHIATGHYARIKHTKNRYELHSGIDTTKDQSYFLYELVSKDLEHILFPLGNLTKKEVRDIAKKQKFPNYNKQGSRGICFVGKVSLQDFLGKKIKRKEGTMIDPEGKIIGKHPGVKYFTIGQRIGPSLHCTITSKEYSGEKLYIASKDIKSNTLVIAPKEHTIHLHQEFLVKKALFHTYKANVSVRIRHLGKLMQATLKKTSKGYTCTLKKPIEALADGQIAVFYDKSRILGGGEIQVI